MDRSGMNVYNRLNSVLKIARLARNLSSNETGSLNHYEILGVEPTATQLVIKNSYFEKSKLYHPDVVGSTETNLREFRRISEAYEVLGNPRLRKEYDEKVLGIIGGETNAEGSAAQNEVRMSSGSNNLHEWTRSYSNDLRRNEYLLKHTVKSYSDFSFKPKTFKIEENSYFKYAEHRLTRLFLVILTILFIFTYKQKDPINIL